MEQHPIFFPWDTEERIQGKVERCSSIIIQFIFYSFEPAKLENLYDPLTQNKEKK